MGNSKTSDKGGDFTDLHWRRLGRRPPRHLPDEHDGARLASRRLPEGLAGIRGFHELVATHAEEPGHVVVGIETDRGLWVEALTAAGYQVYAVNPLAVARYRRWASSSNSTARSPSSKPNWPHILRNTGTPTSTSPCQDSVLCSAPGCSVSSGMTRTATPTPSLARTTPERHP